MVEEDAVDDATLAEVASEVEPGDSIEFVLTPIEASNSLAVNAGPMSSGNRLSLVSLPVVAGALYSENSRELLAGSSKMWNEAGHRLQRPTQALGSAQETLGVKQRQCFRSPGMRKKQSSSIQHSTFSSSTTSISSRNEQSATKHRPRWQLKLNGHCKSCLQGKEAVANGLVRKIKKKKKMK